ncbi:MAG: uroporphyrinogen-III synthase, partial [Fimbriimonadaceae bacterium]|nr:uroporphyrinogen-III synthase [Chitinophagales bacterium]
PLQQFLYAEEYFFDQIKTIPQHIKIAAMGNETASAIHERGYKTDFIGDADIKRTADLFSSIAKNSSVCFPQALHAKEELMNYLDKSIAVIKLPVYDNKIKLHEPVSQHDILVFTSPMNVDGYLFTNTIQSSNILIAIGRTTQEHLQAKRFKNVLTPPVTNLLSVADMICGL